MQAAMSVGPSSTNVSTKSLGRATNVAEMDEVDAAGLTEAPDRGGKVVGHQRDVALAHRHPVRGARLELEDTVVGVEASG